MCANTQTSVQGVFLEQKMNYLHFSVSGEEPRIQLSLTERLGKRKPSLGETLHVE